MKKIRWILSLMVVSMMIAGPAVAQENARDTTKKRQRMHFVDLNNDGLNDNAPDADGDGIPNGLDPDFVRQGGNGKMGANMNGQKGFYAQRGQKTDSAQGTAYRNNGGKRGNSAACAGNHKGGKRRQHHKGKGMQNYGSGLPRVEVNQN